MWFLPSICCCDTKSAQAPTGALVVAESVNHAEEHPQQEEATAQETREVAAVAMDEAPAEEGKAGREVEGEQSPAEENPDDFLIDIAKGQDGVTGLVVETTANLVLVAKVKMGVGPIEKWNQTCEPSQRVSVGDRIIQVNEAIGSGSAITQLKQSWLKHVQACLTKRCHLLFIANMARDRSRTPPRSPSEPSSSTSRLARDSGHTDDLKALNCRHDDHKVGAPLKCAEECRLSSDKCHCDASLGSGHPAVGELQQKRWRDGLSMLKDLIGRRRVSIPPMSSIMSSVTSCWVWERLNLELGDIPVVRNAADTLQLTPTAVVLGSGGGIGFLLYGFGGEFVCNLLGVAYPAFESFKVVEAFANLTEGCPTNIGNKASDMQFWLTYWIVAAMLATFEYLFWILLIRIPFYYPLKLLLLLFLTCPGAGGTNSVYNWLVTPILRRNRHRIDSALEKTNKKFSERICETW